MFHVGNEHYRGTQFENRCMFFHDQLSAFKANEGRDYMDAPVSMGGLGMRHHLLQCYCANVGTIYEGGLTGRFEAMARGLDAFGFAHLKSFVSFHQQLTSCYYNTEREADRFGMGSVKELEYSRRRIWMGLERMDELRSQDIRGLDRVLAKVLLADGVHLPDEELRSGRRAKGLSSEATTTMRRVRARQHTRTLAMRAVYPTAVPALGMIRDAATACWEVVERRMAREAEEEEDSGGSGSGSDSQNE
jgi:hypothetical protein